MSASRIRWCLEVGLIAACVMLPALLGCERERRWGKYVQGATDEQRRLSGNLIGITPLEDAVRASVRDGDQCEPGTADELRRVHAEEVASQVVHVCVGGRLGPGKRLVMAGPDPRAPIAVYGVYETRADLDAASDQINKYLEVFEYLQAGPAHVAIGGIGADGRLVPGAEVRREWSYSDLSVKVWAIDRGADAWDLGYRYVSTAPVGAATRRAGPF